METNTNKAHSEGARLLRRSVEDRKIAGVAGGLATYFDTDVTLVRILLVALCFVSGLGVAFYLAAWALVADVGSDNSIAGDVLLRAWCH
jgi:phage shock protein PspC (stress-responsive transcriptional regulator)